MIREGLGVELRDQSVRLRFPANGSYQVLARAAVAAVCARLDYPLDRLDDVKLAIDEACSLLLSDAKPQSDLHVELTPHSGGGLDLVVTATTNRGKAPRRHTFAWTVLAALVESVSAETSDDDVVTIRMRAGRGSIGESRP